MAAVGSPTTPAGPDHQLLKAGRNENNRPMVFFRLLVIRAFNAYWLCTFFQPDEYFQSLEPAWRMAFGEGSGAWVTWEWRHQLRSSLHPALFAGAYWVADKFARTLPFTAIVRPVMLLATPKAVQTVFAAAGDWYTWQLAVKIYGPDSNYSWFALFMSMCNPFHWYCSTRTFSNSLEMTLSVMALYYWPWELFASKKTVKENPKGSSASALSSTASVNSLRLSLVLAAVAVTLRPTNILIWLTVLPSTLIASVSDQKSSITLSTAVVLAREILLCGSAVLAVSLASDRLYFGAWTFPPYKFLYFNISRSLAVFYGRNPWHYYLSQGLPLLSISYLPFVVMALYKPPVTESQTSNLTLSTLASVVRNMVAALSLISHKEVRFIYPLLPLIHVLAAPYAASFFTSPAPAPTPDKPLPKPKLRHKGYLQAALALNVFLAGFLSAFHQPAPLAVLSYLRHEFERIHPEKAAALPPFANDTLTADDELFAMFLTPCHSTPWRSHLIHPYLMARALTCEPPLHTAPNTVERDTYRDEADRFYDSPVEFLRDELWPTHQADPHARPTLKGEHLPRFIVGFQGIEPWLHAFFVEDPKVSKLGLKPVRVWEGWNGLFNEDWRRTGKLVVWDTGLYSLHSSGEQKHGLQFQ